MLTLTAIKFLQFRQHAALAHFFHHVAHLPLHFQQLVQLADFHPRTFGLPVTTARPDADHAAQDEAVRARLQASLEGPAGERPPAVSPGSAHASGASDGRSGSPRAPGSRPPRATG